MDESWAEVMFILRKLKVYWRIKPQFEFELRVKKVKVEGYYFHCWPKFSRLPFLAVMTNIKS